MLFNVLFFSFFFSIKWNFAINFFRFVLCSLTSWFFGETDFKLLNNWLNLLNLIVLCAILVEWHRERKLNTKLNVFSHFANVVWFSVFLSPLLVFLLPFGKTFEKYFLIHLILNEIHTQLAIYSKESIPNANQFKRMTQNNYCT